MHVTELYLNMYSLPVAKTLYTIVKYGWVGDVLRPPHSINTSYSEDRFCNYKMTIENNVYTHKT